MSTFEKALTVGGPMVFGLIAGGMYGLARMKMKEPLPTETVAWTGKGAKFRLTRLVSYNVPLANELIHLADSAALPLDALRRVQILIEQMLAAESWLNDAGGRDDIRAVDVISQIETMRSTALKLLLDGMVDNGVEFGEDSLPTAYSLRYAVGVILQTLDAIVWNARLVDE